MALKDLTQITTLLEQWAEGDEDAREQLVSQVYGVLRHIAEHNMRQEMDGHTWSRTDLVHEAWAVVEKSVRSGKHFENRRHFLNMFSQVMKHELINHANYHKAQKRGSGLKPVGNIDLDALQGSEKVSKWVEALEALEKEHEDMKGLATAYFLVGLSQDEIADFLGISRPTVVRRLRFARAWLKKEYGVSK